MSSTISTVYIPRMSAFVREQDIAFEFVNSYAVHVARVDFTSCNKKPGFVEDTSDTVKSAFVHFIQPIMHFNATGMYEAFNNNKAYKHQTLLFQEYWLILPNKNPVPYTMMNNAQIVENCRYLEEKVMQQEEEIEKMNEYCSDLEKRLAEQQASIAALEDVFDYIQTTHELKKKMELQDTLNRNLSKQIDNMFVTLVEVIRGLYNPKTQQAIIEKHFSKLSDCTMSEAQRIAYISSNMFPTTRQGDDCEKRIADLEKKFMQLTQIQPLNYDDTF
jgi:uncharacterized coiled-coil protein SlyX